MTQARVERLVPDAPFPPYTFVPGRAPHPKSDPAGHSYGVKDQSVAPLDPERWQESRAYLYGLDLFNAQFYWEAHEELESVWHANGRRGVVADFLKGMIHLAAAGVKHLEGRLAGVTSHASRAAELWRGVRAEVYLGLRVADLVRLADEVCEKGWPCTPPVLMPHQPKD